MVFLGLQACYSQNMQEGAEDTVEKKMPEIWVMIQLRDKNNRFLGQGRMLSMSADGRRLRALAEVPQEMAHEIQKGKEIPYCYLWISPETQVQASLALDQVVLLKPGYLRVTGKLQHITPRILIRLGRLLEQIKRLQNRQDIRLALDYPSG